MELKEKIVFYDGDCGFCNRTVSYVLKNDFKKEIYFAPIQSELCAKLFEQQGWEKPDLSTFYYLENGQLYQKSNAALRLSRNFKYPHKLIASGYIFPRFIRDFVYDVIAKNRKRLSKGYCVIPSEEDRKRFL